MYDLNKAQVIGNLTADPELKYTSNGTAVATVSIATNRRWTDSNGEKHEEADFHNLVFWAKAAEIVAEIASKGNKMFVEGRMQTRNWEDEATGKRMYRMEIVVQDFILLTPKGGSDGSKYDHLDDEVPPGMTEISASGKRTSTKKAETKPATGSSSDPEAVDPDDIPF